MKRIPIAVAKRVSEETGCRQVILMAWDGKLTHIVTYGKSVDDCAQAAAGGNMLKERWGWPECNDQPSRVKQLEQRAQAAEAERDKAKYELSEIRRKLNTVVGDVKQGISPMAQFAALATLIKAIAMEPTQK